MALNPSTTAHESLDEWIKSVGDISAPVLAGFSITVVIAVAEDPTRFRWPGLAILALTVAATTLIATLQSARHALKIRWPRDDGAAASGLGRRIWYLSLTAEERTWFWRKKTRSFYHAGLTALSAGLAFALAPPSGAKDEALRWLATILALLAGVVEALVVIVNSYVEKER